MYVIENLINGHVTGPNGACAPGMPTVEAAVWIQYISGNLCGAFKLHEGTFCFLTGCLPCGFAAVRIDFNYVCMTNAIQWLAVNSPGTLSANPILFNVGFLGCNLCSGGGGGGGGGGGS